MKSAYFKSAIFLFFSILFAFVAFAYYSSLYSGLHPSYPECANCVGPFPQPNSYYYLVDGGPAIIASIATVINLLCEIYVLAKKKLLNSTRGILIIDTLLLITTIVFFFR